MSQPGPLNAGAPSSTKRRKPKRPKRAVGNKERARGGVNQRAHERFKALRDRGGVKGVDATDGFTGREVRKIRSTWIDKGKPKKPKHAGGGGGGGGGGNSEQRRFRQLMGEADRQADYEYGAEETLLNRQLKREGAHTQTIDQAFNTYKARVDELIAQQSAANAASAAAMQAGQQKVEGAVAGLSDNSAAEIQGRADLLGLGNSAATAQTDAAAQGKVTAAKFGAIDQAQVAQTGQAAVSGLRSQAISGEAGRVQAHRDSAGRVRELEADRKKLQKDKRNFRSKTFQAKQDKAQETYLAILALQSKEMTAAEDRKLRLQLGLLDSKDAAAERRSRERMNDQDNATSILNNNNDNATQLANGGSGGSKGAGGLPPGQRREWRQKKAHYEHGAQRMRRNLERFKDTDSAWHQTAIDLGGRLSRDELSAMWWLAKGGKLPRGVVTFLKSEFPGGRSPWG